VNNQSADMICTMKTVHPTYCEGKLWKIPTLKNAVGYISSPLGRSEIKVRNM